MKSKMIFGFHAVTARLRHEASSVEEIYVDAGRSDRRMQELLAAAKAVNVRVIVVDDQRLNNIVGTRRHQGVVAKAGELSLARNLDELLDAIDGGKLPTVDENLESQAEFKTQKESGLYAPIVMTGGGGAGSTGS